MKLEKLENKQNTTNNTKQEMEKSLNTNKIDRNTTNKIQPPMKEFAQFKFS